MDQLPQSWTDRVNELIDTTDAGQRKMRKMRYGKMKMKDWDLLMRINRWRAKPKKPDKHEGRVLCRNGDNYCACLVIGHRCRVEE